MRKTDVGKIIYPTGLSVAQRRRARSIITAIASTFDEAQVIVVACSGGIDSTVLTHALSQALRIRPTNKLGQNIVGTACYINHNLRPEENKIEIEHVTQLNSNLSFNTPPQNGSIGYGPGIQMRAREIRYNLLHNVVLNYAEKYNSDSNGTRLWTAHSANDQAETKLYQFIKGIKPVGIRRKYKVKPLNKFSLERPLLDFTREDIEEYAKCFGLTWCEDSSNKTENYSRNKIRHSLIPWIKENINAGIVNSMKNM